MSSEFKVDLIEHTTELEVLRSEWRSLWQRDVAATPFQSSAWLIPWWMHLGEGSLLTLTIRRRGELVGLLPLYIYTDPTTGKRNLLFIGSGTTDYLGGMFEPEARISAIAAAIRTLQNEAHRWDEAHLYQLRADSALTKYAREVGLPIVATEPCWRFEIAPDGQIHGKLRQNLSRYRKLAESRGTLSYHSVSPSNCLELFESLVDLHSRRWRLRGNPGVLSDAKVQQAHRAAIPQLARERILRMHSLSINGQIVAVVYGLVDPPNRPNRTLYYYLNGFHPDWADCSPGSLVLAYTAEKAAAEGIRHFDFLRGRERYKQHWKAHAYPTYGVSLPAESAQPRTAGSRKLLAA